MVVSFDHVNHDILMGRIAQVIRDKRVLHLIGKYLRRGAMVNGVVTASVEGTPQGHFHEVCIFSRSTINRFLPAVKYRFHPSVWRTPRQ